MEHETRNSQLILGIDGGGSKTRALLVDHSGAVLGVGVAASSNYQSVGFAAATAAIVEARAAALAAAGLDASVPVAAICLGLAGVDRPADRVRWEHWLADTGLAQRFVVCNDAELLLAVGTPDGWGVALICGTGSICWGRAPDGRTARAGGWGYLLGDEGSGYDLALQALRLATQTADGRADAALLLQAALDHWQVATPTELIAHVYAAGVPRSHIAAFAGRVVALAETNDEPARRLLHGAAVELGRMVAVVVRKLALDAPPVALAGGLLGASSLLQDAIPRAAGVVLGPRRFVDDPAQGALVLARRLLAHAAER